MIILNNLERVNFGGVLNAKAEEGSKAKSNNTNKQQGDNKTNNSAFIEVVQDRKIFVSDEHYIVVSASTMEGDEDVYVDVRLYKKTEKFEGPTKKGIRIHIEFLEDLIEALTLINTDLEEQGL